MPFILAKKQSFSDPIQVKYYGDIVVPEEPWMNSVGLGAPESSANVTGDHIFRQASQPDPKAAKEGDLWYDTDDDNHPYKLVNGTWTSIQDTGVISSPGVGGWSHNLVFSVTDYNTVAWATGTITLQDGTAYSITGSDTGEMAAVTYIYLDTSVSTTALQTTTTASTSVGINKILVAVAKQNSDTAKDAEFQVFGGFGQTTFITADNIAADTITANEIAANAITTSELNAASVTAVKVSISQLSAISADLGTITAGTVTGATIQTATSGARVVFNSSGIQAYDSTPTQRVNIANDGSGWFGTSSAFAWTAAGAVSVTSITINTSTIDQPTITSMQSGSDVSLSEWTYSGAFSVTDADTIAWATGTLTLSTGQAFSITGSNTGNMVAKTYIYFDKSVSQTAFQTTTTLATAVGTNKILIAVAQNSTDEATFFVFNKDEMNIDAANIRANSITANEIAASTITTNEIAANTIVAGNIAAGAIETDELAAGAVTAAKISVSQLSAISANMGTITAGTVTGATIQTSSSATVGIKLDSTSLRGYNASNTVTFELNPSTGVLTASAVVLTGLQAGSNIDAQYITGDLSSSVLNLADQGWTQTCAFSVTDADTVAWGAGSFVASDGTTYSIGASNTGNMLARTYIYLDIAVSTTAYQTTTTASTAVGAGKVLIATAVNGTDEAEFEVFGGVGGSNINASQIVASSITANEIAASTITAGKLSISQLSAISADLGTITAGTVTGATIQTASSGDRFVMTSTTFRGIETGGNVIFEILLTGGDAGDVIMGDDATGKYAKWDDSAGTFTVSQGTLSSPVITSVQSGSDPSMSEWTYSGAFSVTDADTVAWATGTLTLSTGQTFSITGANTGNMTAKTYIYFDKDASTTLFQTTTTLSTAVGTNKILIAVAENSTDEAVYFAFNKNEMNIDGANIKARSITASEIAADTITANEIAANAITSSEINAGAVTATKISVTTLSAISADLGTITAGTITGGTFQTSSSATVGIKFDSTSLRGYNASNTVTFELNPSTGVLTASAVVLTGLQAGSDLDAQYLTGSVSSARLNVADRGWSQTSAFSVTDADTVAWCAGSFVASDGTTYSIGSGNTGNMAARTYIYLDIGVSTTAYQTTTTAATAVGAGKVLIATAINGSAEAEFEVFGGLGGSNINASQIVASSITANEIAASTITAGKLTISTLSAITADLGTITAGTITGGTIQTASSGARVVFNSTGIEGYDATTQRFDLSNDGSGWFGSSTAFKWTSAGAVSVTSITINTSTIDGDSTINGSTGTNVQSRAETFFTEYDFAYLGQFLDDDTGGFTASASGGNILRYVLSSRFETSGITDGVAQLMSNQLLATADDSEIQFNDASLLGFAINAEFGTTTQILGFFGFDLFSNQFSHSTAKNGGTVTTRHVGFIFDDAAIYASCADGTTQNKSSDLASGITVTDENYYEIVLNGTTNALFYINGTLKATLSSNLPSAGGSAVQTNFGLLTDENSSKHFVIKNNYIIYANK